VNVENGPDGEHDGPAADAARVLHNPTQESHKRIGNMQIAIQPAGADASDEIAPLVGELLGEIMAAIGEQAFIFSLGEATVLLRELLDQGKYLVLVARTEAGQSALRAGRIWHHRRVLCPPGIPLARYRSASRRARKGIRQNTGLATA
jgi:hypothetical protein